MGIYGDVVNWIVQFLANSKHVVRVFGDNVSPFFLVSADVKSGVLQGTVLGQTLFNVSTNNKPSIIENKILQYADDSKIIGSVCYP